MNKPNNCFSRTTSLVSGVDDDDFTLSPISIIGRSSNGNVSDSGQKSNVVMAEDDHEAFSSGDELRHSKKPTGFLQAIKVRGLH